MTKEQKYKLVEELTEVFKEYPNFYIADAGGLTVEKVNKLRRLCHEKEVKLQMVKNTLIRKALEKVDGDFSEVYEILKQPSSIFFTTAENPSVPAKIIQEFRKSEEKPVLKAAVIDTAVFVGDEQLKALSNMKSKNELIGDIVGLLQSPAKNVISALQSGGGKLAGILKTLSERAES
ncbi:MAG: 50S ribosomal protein L10 [Bacteroidetes bacterium]|nr:MAG: 50S ribosomal protein L10 [Bacteroidota bacterium]